MWIDVWRVKAAPRAAGPSIQRAGEGLECVEGRGQRDGGIGCGPEPHTSSGGLDRVHLGEGSHPDACTAVEGGGVIEEIDILCNGRAPRVLVENQGGEIVAAVTILPKITMVQMLRGAVDAIVRRGVFRVSVLLTDMDEAIGARSGRPIIKDPAFPAATIDPIERSIPPVRMTKVEYTQMVLS